MNHFKLFITFLINSIIMYQVLTALSIDSKQNELFNWIKARDLFTQFYWPVLLFRLQLERNERYSFNKS